MTAALASAALLLANTGVADIYVSRKFGISFKPRNSLKKTTEPFFHRVGCSFVTPADALPQRRQLPFAASDEVAETEPSELSEVENNDEEIEENDADTSDDADVEQEPPSLMQMLKQSYKQAIAVNDESKIAEVETQLQSMEDERNTLSQQALCLREELATEKERFLRLNADFDNFRWDLDQRLKSTICEANMTLPEVQYCAWFVVSLTPHLRTALSQQKISTQAEALETAMRLHETPIQDPGLGVQQIHAQLQNLCLEMQSLKQDRTPRPVAREESVMYQMQRPRSRQGPLPCIRKLCWLNPPSILPVN